MNTTYENAPATRLVATHCCVCGRPLVDAESVRTGIGPICAENYGVAQARNTPEYARANALIYSIAAGQANWNAVQPLIAELANLCGFAHLAAKIAKRLTPKPQILVTEDAGMLKVEAPFKAEATPLLRQVPGRRFIKETVEGKEVAYNLIPAAQRGWLNHILATCYKGLVVKSPRGTFLIA